MKPRRSLDEVAHDARSRSVPLVFLDTCAVIDVVRFASPERAIKLAVLEDTRRLVNAARRRDVVLVGSELLALEIADNLNREAEGASQNLERRADEMARVFAGLDLQIGGDVLAVWSGLRPRLQQLPDELRRLSDALLSESSLVHDDRECIERARVRAVLKFAPSHRKESRKDCEIFEHALALSKKLKDGGHTRRRVFATSNFTDFDPGLLRDQLDDAGLDLVPSLSDAYKLIGRP